MRSKEERSFGGFHLHFSCAFGCQGPQVEVPALEHEHLVREAERHGCDWLASLRHSHPLCLVGTNMPSHVLEEVDRLLADPTVDDRARAPALWIRGLHEQDGADSTAVTACGVGTDPYEEPRWA